MTTRRKFLTVSAALAAVAAAFPLLAQYRAPRPMTIGVIGSGRIGGTIGKHWVKAGHQVMFSAKTLEEAKGVAAEAGAGASAGTPREAALFGDAILMSVPYVAVPELGKELAAELKGKIVLETGNPYPQRDGDMAHAARQKGTGIASAEFLPGTRLVRAFNSMSWMVFLSEAYRPGERVAVPLAGDDAEALKVAEQLVTDAGFEPVVVGRLARAKEFDVNAPVYGKPHTARELRKALKL